MNYKLVALMTLGVIFALIAVYIFLGAWLRDIA